MRELDPLGPFWLLSYGRDAPTPAVQYRMSSSIERSLYRTLTKYSEKPRGDPRLQDDIPDGTLDDRTSQAARCLTQR